MSQTPQPNYLSIERAMEFIGDANGVLSLLKTLQQTLHTRNQSDQPFVLTQALHSYFAVGDAHQVGI